jgi:hypothetical protein
MLVFCALSIAMEAVDEHSIGRGFGNRWYAIAIFIYTFIVRY